MTSKLETNSKHLKVKNKKFLKFNTNRIDLCYNTE